MKKKGHAAKACKKKKARAELKTESHQSILIKEEDYSIQSNEGLYNIFQASKLKPSPLLKV